MSTQYQYIMVITTIKAKWGKVEFDLLVDSSTNSNRSESVLSQISAKTNIPKEKIKVIPPTILNPSSMVKEGMKVMVMGTAEDQQLSAPEHRTQFIEDMSPEEIATALRLRQAEPMPVGLENLGNTCFLNAVLQCLARLPGVRKALSTATGTGADAAVITHTRNLLTTLGTTTAEDSFTPSMFVAMVRARFPQFNQTDSHGHYAQQDAEEFLRSLLQVLHPLDPLFAFTQESVWRCLDPSSAEPETVTTEEHKTLTCHMGTQLEPVSHLHEGLQLALKETITKEAISLGNKSVQFEKKSGLTSLPPYLVVQFARFQWKAKSDSAGTEATKTKITRKVTFQKTLDLYDLCTASVKAELDVGRELRRVQLETGALLEDIQVADQHVDGAATGVYELVAIVSHQGRTSDGGHYVGWTKRARRPDADAPPPKKINGNVKSDEDAWVKFDDETVSETTWTAMTETGGMLGGLADSQMAYLLFYAKTTVAAGKPE